jgi:hypothetical protein
MSGSRARSRFLVDGGALMMVASTIVFGLLPATVVGWTTNLEYLHVAYGGLLQMAGLGGDTLSAVALLVTEPCGLVTVRR